MATKEERYAAIAANMRAQQIADLPPKHEWVELITRLCRNEDKQLREIGITELRNCADRATHGNHN
jgi:HD-like signal output (HDOD) protein